MKTIILRGFLCVTCLSLVGYFFLASRSSSRIYNTYPPVCQHIGQIWTSPIDGLEMVCVPAGSFIMGAAQDDAAAGEDEKPQHSVFVNAFWVDRFEVTNEAYDRCMAEDACHPEIYERSAITYIPYSIHPDFRQHPALVYLSKDAQDYCRWAGKRLPTEAEWEKAARGSDGRLYPWGNTLDCGQANYYICDHLPPESPQNPRCGYSSYCHTAKVDEYPEGASPYGAFNMAGNVWEWVSDRYSPEYYAMSPYMNPVGPDTGKYLIRKGGGCTSLAVDLRVTNRASGKGEHYYDGQMGFRCAVDAPSPP
ncbi:MAG: formylglycine-generating enzyme family protein [Leptolinea sp.]|jgi:formylglycine-generating enzyme required for sulfatase activity|nr:formylglycine-generating enzyme family protein [Leptolinea sp.]